MAKYRLSQICLTVAAGAVLMSLSACAGQQGHNGYSVQGSQTAQYGGHAQFESGRCGPACQNATSYSPPVHTSGPSSYYTPPAPTLVSPTPSHTGYGSGYVGSSSCGGATAQSGGSCAPSYSGTQVGTVTSATSVTRRQMDCPVGTVRQADGSCLHTSRSFSGTCGSTSTCGSVGITRHTITTQQANCPAGTVKQADGSCLQPSSSGTVTRRTGTYSGYSSGGYGLHDYRPVRK